MRKSIKWILGGLMSVVIVILSVQLNSVINENKQIKKDNLELIERNNELTKDNQTLEWTIKLCEGKPL